MKKITFGILLLITYLITSVASLKGEITDMRMLLTFMGIQIIMILVIFFYPENKI